MKITPHLINNSNDDIFGEWINNLDPLINKFNNAEPFEHVIINDFLKTGIANRICNEYPEDLNDYHKYNNPLEIKYAYDDIPTMTPNLQNVFYSLCSEKIVNVFRTLIKNENLEYDPTCHGGRITYSS